MAGLLPAPALALTRAAQSDEAAEAARINDAFEPLWALFKRCGSFRVMFVIAELLGLGNVKPPRPVLPLADDATEDVQLALELLERAWPAQSSVVMRPS